MKTLSFVFVIALAGFGCKHDTADCTNAIDHSMELAKSDMAGIDAATIQKMKDLGVQHCKDDHWAAAAIECMISAHTKADAQACYGKLTPEQQANMNNAAKQGVGK